MATYLRTWAKGGWSLSRPAHNACSTFDVHGFAERFADDPPGERCWDWMWKWGGAHLEITEDDLCVVCAAPVIGRC